MSENKILANIQKHISLDAGEIQHLNSILKVRFISRKENLLKQGQSCRNIFFVEQGSFRAFNINDDGKESTLMFAIQDWWITDLDCFVNKKPSMLSIESLEDSKVIELDVKLLEELYEKIPKFERFFRILFQNAYIREQQRALYNISYSTEERYLRFIQKYPTITEKITQKQIASYLGVTPEFLSSVKNKIKS